jgi:hypothetical protein
LGDDPHRTRGGYLILAAKNESLTKENEALGVRLAAQTQLAQDRLAEVEELRGEITDLKEQVLQAGQHKKLTSQERRSAIIQRHVALVTNSNRVRNIHPKDARDKIERAELSQILQNQPVMGICENRSHAALQDNTPNSEHQESGNVDKQQDFRRQIRSAHESIVDLNTELRSISAGGDEAESVSKSSSVPRTFVSASERKPLIQGEDTKVAGGADLGQREVETCAGAGATTAAEAEQLPREKEAEEAREEEGNSEGLEPTALMLSELQHDDVLFSEWLQAQAKIDELIKECTALRMHGIVQV